MKTLAAHNAKLNHDRYEFLHFTNELGTDLTIGLVDDHIWAGGGEVAKNGVYFAPNIPTEETLPCLIK
jgi:aminopeptidase